MLIGVLSDVHDNLENLGKALTVYETAGIETLCFLGDFCSPIPARKLGGFNGTVHCVFGNGDGDRFTIKLRHRHPHARIEQVPQLAGFVRG